MWEKVNKNDGVYIFQSYEVWLSGKKMIEGNETMSNTKKYSGKNILEKARWFRGTKDQNSVKKRRAVDGAQAVN